MGASSPPTNYPLIFGQGIWTANRTMAQTITGPQFNWASQVKITYTAHTGSSVKGETITGSTSGATGILVQDTGTVLTISPLTGTFQAQEFVTGGGGGSFAVTGVTASSFELPVSYNWSAYLNQKGILATNANTQRRGGATVSATFNSWPTMYKTGSGVYVLNNATQSIITYGGVVGGVTFFKLGEQCTQAISGAVGYVYADNQTNTLSIEVFSGTFDGSHNITGATSGAITSSVSAVANTNSVNFLEWSPDGWTNFVPVTTVNNPITSTIQTFPGSLIDCGIIAGSILGKTNTRVLIWCDYGEGNCSLKFCQPDINPFLWTTILTVDGTAGTLGAWPFIGNLSTITYSGLTGGTGNFILGEQVIQAVSGATGYLLTNNGTTTLGVVVSSGTFDGTHNITGQTSNTSTSSVSNAVLTTSGSDQSVRHFHGSQWVPLIGAKEGRLFLRSGDQDYQNGMYTCDDIADLCNNGSNWKTNWAFNLCGPARIAWFCNTSTTQVTCNYTGKASTNAFGFYKGEQVTQATSGAVGFIATDSGYKSPVGTGTLTILLAVGSPAFNNSGIITGTSSATTATASSMSTATIGGGKNYCLGDNTVAKLNTKGYPGVTAGGANQTGVQGVGGQDCRSVDLVIDGTSTYGYFIPDNSLAYTDLGCHPTYDGYAAPNGVNFLRRVDLVNKTVQTVGTRVTGTGWVGCYDPASNAILLTTESDRTAGGGAYYANNDAYCHMYQVGSDLSSIWEIAKFLRTDYLNPTATGPATISALFPAFGAIWGWDAQKLLFGGDPIGTISAKPAPSITDSSTQKLNATPSPLINWVEGGQFAEAIDSARWYLQNLNHFSIGTTFLDKEEAGKNSVTVDCNGALGTCYAQYIWQAKWIQAMQGKFISVRIRVLAPVSLNASQTPGLQIVAGTGDNSLFVTIAKSDQWQTITIPAYWVSSNETAINLRVIPDLTNTYTGSIYISDVCVVEGTQCPVGKIPSRNQIVNSLALGQYGLQTISCAANTDVTLTALNLFAVEYTLSGGTGSTPINIIFPAIVGNTGNQTGTYRIINNTNPYDVTIKQTGQTGFLLKAGCICLCYFNGTDMVQASPQWSATALTALNTPQTVKVGTQFDKSSDTTLANVTNLTVNVVAAGVYQFTAVLLTTCAAGGGSKVSISGTATHTSIAYNGWVTTAANAGVTALSAAKDGVVAAATAANVTTEIMGTCTVNAAGTLTVQFAQNAASGTSSVLVGSYLQVERIA